MGRELIKTRYVEVNNDAWHHLHSLSPISLSTHRMVPRVSHNTACNLDPGLQKGRNSYLRPSERTSGPLYKFQNLNSEPYFIIHLPIPEILILICMMCGDMISFNEYFAHFYLGAVLDQKKN